MSSAFELNGVTCRFGDLVAIDEVSLSIEEGEQVAFIGPSGSGKTTLIRLLNTTAVPNDGSLSVLGNAIAGQSVESLRVLRSRVGTMPQHLGLVKNLTAIQNVILGGAGNVAPYGQSVIFLFRHEVIPKRSISCSNGLGSRRSFLRRCRSFQVVSKSGLQSRALCFRSLRYCWRMNPFQR